MKSFFLSVIKQFFVFILAGILLACLFVSFIWLLVVTFESKPAHIPKDSVLIIDVGMAISDSEGEKELSDEIEGLIHPNGQSAYLLEVLNAIEFATEDPRIIGIFLKGGDTSYQGTGYPILHEVRKALGEFQKSGKMLISYFTEACIKDYFLGSIANTIVLNPLGQVQLKGLAAEMTYFGDAFEKYGIGMQITKSGKYKAAVEPFTSSHMSDFQREQTTLLLADMWESAVALIADGRNLNKNDLKVLSEKTALFLPTDAKNHRLVDFIEYEDQAFARFNLTELKEADLLGHKISLRKYIKETESKKLLQKVTEHQSKIAIVYIEGEILEGEGTSFSAGANRLERRLNDVRDDETIKAVVLRVNSPGGSAHASDRILRAVRLLQTKKPVVVSFGTYAASGGYWISCYGSAIFTDPMTITGSIGVFGLLPNLEKIAQNHGVNFEEVSTGPLATIDSLFRPRTPEELTKLQNHTDLIYHAFLQKVAEGRKLELSNVEAIADGRVWSGFRAKEIGLVDFYGGIKDAITHSAALAKLTDWEITQYARERTIGYEILHFFQRDSEIKLFPTGIVNKYLKRIEKEIESYKNYNDPSSIYARMPFSFIPY